MPDRPYRLEMPQSERSCVVFSSPHSGDEYPADFLARTRLDSLAIRSSEDAFVDQLFSAAPDHGAPLLAARLPRAYVDLNRAATELDAALVRGVRRQPNNPRIAAGLGVIPRVVANHRVIRSGKMSLGEAERRLQTVYTPYHKRLSALLEETRARFGMAILFDCHSMPPEATAPLPDTGRAPDIVIGDRFGASAAPHISESVVDIFAAAGFDVALNRPYAGGYITKTYGRPSQNLHAVQIEINRALYMDGETLTPTAGFAPLRARLSGIIRKLAGLGQQQMPFAAE